jgi:hypothetical protein
MALLAATSVSAQTPQSNLVISLGWFPTNFSTSARLDPNDTTPGTDVDLENDLGLNSNASNIRLDAMWKVAKRHRIDISYTSWKRSGDVTLQTPIHWRDHIYDAGAHVKAENNAQFIKLAYNYAWLQTDTSELNVSAGFDTIWNKTGIEGEGTISGPNGGVIHGNYVTDEDYVAPAPVVGINFSHLATNTWLVRGSAEYFQATFNKTTAKLLDVRASTDYLFSPSWSAGLGYTWVGYKVNRTRFDATYNFSGPLLYLSYRR